MPGLDDLKNAAEGAFGAAKEAVEGAVDKVEAKAEGLIDGNGDIEAKVEAAGEGIAEKAGSVFGAAKDVVAGAGAAATGFAQDHGLDEVAGKVGDAAKGFAAKAGEVAGGMVDKAEQLTGLDIDGDGTVAGEPAPAAEVSAEAVAAHDAETFEAREASLAADVEAKTSEFAEKAGGVIGSIVDKAEELTGMDINGDGTVASAAPVAEEAAAEAQAAAEDVIAPEE